MLRCGHKRPRRGAGFIPVDERIVDQNARAAGFKGKAHLANTFRGEGLAHGGLLFLHHNTAA